MVFRTKKGRYALAAVAAIALTILLYTVVIGVPSPTYTLTLTVFGEGAVHPETGTYRHHSGDRIGLKADVPAGYKFLRWTTSRDSVANVRGTETSFIMPSEDAVVIGHFVPREYQVVFQDWDEQPLAVRFVRHGQPANPPADPQREGYTFVGWDTDTTTVLDNRMVTAAYRRNAYTVTFKDGDGRTLTSEPVEHGHPPNPPPAPEREGYTFIGWDTEPGPVTEDLTVTAVYRINHNTVTFRDWDGELLAMQRVRYGQAATAPPKPIREGHTFIGWDSDLERITGDQTITALYQKNTYPTAFAAANPLAQITIQVSARSSSEDADALPVTVMTDAQGEAVVELPLGDYEFTARLDNYHSYHSRFTVKDGRQTIGFALTPRDGSLHGTVIDRATSADLPGARIRIYQETDHESTQVVWSTTAQAGRYAAALLPPGPYTVQAEAPHYHPTELSVIVGPGEDVRDIELALAPIIQDIGRIELVDSGDDWISFLVTDTAGRPYDGSAPWAVSLQEQSGRALKDARFSISYRTRWHPNISSSGEARLSFDDLRTAFGWNADVDITIETSDGAVEWGFVVRLIRWANRIRDVHKQ